MFGGNVVRSLKLLPCLLLLTGGLAACQGRIAPLSAQQGSTILIPLDGESGLTPAERGRVGYGGSKVSDPQRGELVYRLDGPSGFELVTLGSTRVKADVVGVQLVSLVEIPIDAPLGSHDLFVAHRRFDPATGSVVEQPGPDYHGQLSILPSAISVSLPGGGSELIEGRPTPLEAFADIANGWVTIAPTWLQPVVPKPELRIALSADTPIWAVEGTVVVRAAVAELVDIRDASSSGSPAVVWLKDLGVSWSYHGYVGSAAGTSAAISSLAFPFTLVDANAALLDPASVITADFGAWDREGNPISVQVTSVTVF